MKKIIGLFGCVLLTLNVFALEIEVVSEEFNDLSAGTVPISINLKSEDIAYNIAFGATVSQYNFELNKAPFRISPGTSVNSFDFKFDRNVKPNTVQEVMVDVGFSNSTANESTSFSFYVYFTPYGTLEVWNEGDFENLNRVWFRSATEVDEVFKGTKKDIPKPTITLHQYDSLPDSLVTTVEVPGLAYGIPMHIDSLENPEQRILCSNNRFKGKIKGKVIGKFFFDDGRLSGSPTISKPLKGMQVKLYRKNWIGYSVKVATLTTNNNGEFEYNFNKKLCFGDEKKFFVKVFARNEEHEIWSHRGYLALRANKVESGRKKMKSKSDGDDVDFGEIQTNHAHRAVNWVNMAWEFCEAQGLQFDKGLRIKISNSNNSFLPNKVNGVNITSLVGGPLLALATGDATAFFGGPLAYIVNNNPSIYLSTNSCRREGTPYHEFGHFVMWQLQNTRWVDIKKGSYASHSPGFMANSIIAWTEGWADGFSGVVDIYYEDYDGESRYDSWQTLDEVLPDSDDAYRFSEGMRSTYSIARSIIDFWDGGNNSSNDNDIPRDQLSVSFKKLVQPIKDHSFSLSTPSLAIEDFGQYYEGFVNDLSTCEDKSEAGSILILNEIMLNGDEFNHESINAPYGEGVLASGKIRESVDITSPAYDHLLKGYRAFDTPMDINFTKHTSGLNITEQDLIITDPIFTNNITGVEFSSPQINTVAEGSTCGRADLQVRNGKTLTVGKSNYPYDLTIEKGIMLFVNSGGVTTVKSGSILRIAKDGNIKVESGATLNIEQGGKLIIESGANVCLDPSANINFSSFDDLVIMPHESGVETKTSYSGLSAFNCKDFEDLFAYNYNLNLELVGGNIDCNNGSFHFTIPNWNTLPTDAQICWDFPEQWRVYANPNCERWAHEVNGSLMIMATNH